MARRPDRAAQTRLDGFIDRFTPETAALARDVLARMRDRLPWADQLVYDNYNALAIGFGPNDRTSDATFSIAVFPRRVSLFFLWGAGLHDPKSLLQGNGRQARHIVLERADRLDDPGVRSLMDAALAEARAPYDTERRGRLIIKSVSPTQRPRRPAAARDSTSGQPAEPGRDRTRRRTS